MGIKIYPQMHYSLRYDSTQYFPPRKSPVDLRTGMACPINTQTTAEMVVKWDNYFIGVSNPQYKSQIRLANNATTGASGFKREITRKGANVGVCSIPHDYWCGSCSYTSGTILPLPVHLGVAFPPELEATNRALSKFVRKAQSKMTPFSGGVMLGEIRRTLSMIRSPLLALRGSVSRYFTELKEVQRRLGIVNPYMSPATRKRLRRALGSTYLEYAFGWRQLIRDIGDASAALENIRPIEVVKVNGDGQAFNSTEGPLQSVSASGHMITFRTSTSLEDSVIVYGGVKTMATPPSAASAIGLTLPDFAPTAWELLPWSFLVDYFLNIQEIIGAATQVNAGLSWAGMTRKKIWSSHQQIMECRNVNKDTTYSMQTNPGSVDLVDTYINRVSLSSVIPGIYWEMPGKLAILNMSALLLQHGSVRRPFY